MNQLYQPHHVVLEKVEHTLSARQKESLPLLRVVMEGVALAVLASLVPLAVYIDIAVIGHGLPDVSVTEALQESILLATALLFFASAWHRPEYRSFLVLVGGFFTCMLIRELDYAFDAISHGFWVWPAVLVAIASISFGLRGAFMAPMGHFIQGRGYPFILFGLITVIVFSRIFGSGSLLWEDLMGADYQHAYKSAIQEGIELFGYVFIGYGAFLCTSHMKEDQHTDLYRL